MDETIKKLKELLGEKEDIHHDYYLMTKELFINGLTLPVKLHLDNETKENVLLSTFSIYRNLLQLISSDRLNKGIDDYLGKSLIWENDILEIELIQNNKVVFQDLVSFVDLEQSFRDKVIKSPQLIEYEGKESFVKIKLTTPAFERKYNEMFGYTVEHKMQEELRKIKEKLVFAHKECLNGSEESKILAMRLIHRLKLWGYDFTEANYLTESFSEVLQKDIQLNSLHFRHTWAITQLHSLLMDSYTNESLIKEIEFRLEKETEKLQASYNTLLKFKS